jgi:hypothetical protein
MGARMVVVTTLIVVSENGERVYLSISKEFRGNMMEIQ